MINKLTHGSLFTGIGGFDIASDRIGWKNVFMCEKDEFCLTLLKYYWPKLKIYKDVSITNFRKYKGKIDVLSGGFPCQDASIANQSKGIPKGLQGEQTSLVKEMLRAIDEIRPLFVVAENVHNLLKINNGNDFKHILYKISRMGYNAEWRSCYASEKGAPHKRKRVYMVIYSSCFKLQKDQTFIPYVQEQITPWSWMPNRTNISINRGGYYKKNEPPFLWVDDGISQKLGPISFPKWIEESIKAYGNSVIPEIPFSIFKTIQNYVDNYSYYNNRPDHFQD